MQNYIIGIDAGGTKTTACAFSMSGELLLTTTSSFGNVTLNFNEAIKNIRSAVDEIISSLGDGYSMIVLGGSGIETGDNKALVRFSLGECYQDNVYVTNDAMLALYSALKGKNGILIIAGTGSIGYLKHGDQLHRFGGWGHLINDDGSGYSIVMKAIRYIAYSFDTNKSDTLLKTAIFEQLKITELRELVDFTYKATKGELASLVPTIVQVAIDGDEQAKSILRWAGERLAYLALGLCDQYNVIKPKIAISGSIIKKIDVVKDSFCHTLNSELTGYTLVDDDFNPARGGYYIAMEQLEE